MPGPLLITNAQIVTADRRPANWLLVRDGIIDSFGDGDPPPVAEAGRIDAHGAWLLPGFIDLHVHGAIGHDTMDASSNGLLEIARFFARHGVTSFLPTTMTAPHERIMSALRVVCELMDKPTGGARILGAHLEGPYINPAMPGAQNPAYVRRADPAETRELLDVGAIRRITLAPEFPENRTFLTDAVAQEISVSAGHTQATPDDLREAIRLGLRYTTHTFNAMIGLHHRNPGTAGAALAFDELTCELISDGIHVHPLVIKVLIRAKGLERVILITDAMAGAGMPDGQYELGDLAVTVADGQARLTQGGSLAGSVLTFDRGFQIAREATGLSIADAWAMSSANAARALGADVRKGQIERGYDADLILLNDTGEVQTTMVSGETVFDLMRT
ncbi:MAG: N-acetylglucosamine-6-phosphate deacetylase [Aggregatilineales bacterium]